jgi:hypothetical protein
VQHHADNAQHVHELLSVRNQTREDCKHRKRQRSHSQSDMLP